MDTLPVLLPGRDVARDYWYYGITVALIILGALSLIWRRRLELNNAVVRRLRSINAAPPRLNWAQHLHPRQPNGDVYQAGLLSVLRWLDRYFGKNAFSQRTFLFCISLSLIYPLLFTLITWVSTDTDIFSVGWVTDRGNIESHHSLFSRLTYMVALFALVWCLCFAERQSQDRSTKWLMIAVPAILVVSLFGVGEFAIFSALLIVYAIKNDGRAAFFPLFIFIAAYLDILSLFNSDATSIAGILILLAILYLVLRPSTPHWQPQRRFDSLLIVVGALVLLAVSAATAGRWGTGDPMVANTILFLMVLPVVNAVLDWASIGVTRSLLRRAVHARSASHRLAIALFDVFVAILLVFVLTIATVGLLRLVNYTHSLSGGSTVLVDYDAILDLIAASPGDPALWWIYAILFTVFLPSVIHAIAASVWVPTRHLFRRSLETVSASLRRAEDVRNPVRSERLARRMTGLEIAKWGLPTLGVSTILAGLFVYSFGIIPTVGGWLLALARWTAGLPPAL